MGSLSVASTAGHAKQEEEGNVGGKLDSKLQGATGRGEGEKEPNHVPSLRYFQLPCLFRVTIRMMDRKGIKWIQ